MTGLGSLHRAASLCVGTIVATTLLTSVSLAQQAYPSPEEAAAALAAAVKTGTTSALLKVLGKDGRDIVESGDDVADAEARQRFLSAYEAKHSVKAEGNKKATLILGADEFPFPIPLVNNRTGWEFDPAAGRLEILYRRIGRNELDAIQTCLAFVDAQNEYAEKDRTGMIDLRCDPFIICRHNLNVLGRQLIHDQTCMVQRLNKNDRAIISQRLTRDLTSWQRLSLALHFFHNLFPQ